MVAFGKRELETTVGKAMASGASKDFVDEAEAAVPAVGNKALPSHAKKQRVGKQKCAVPDCDDSKVSGKPCCFLPCRSWDSMRIQAAHIQEKT